MFSLDIFDLEEEEEKKQLEEANKKAEVERLFQAQVDRLTQKLTARKERKWISEIKALLPRQYEKVKLNQEFNSPDYVKVLKKNVASLTQEELDYLDMAAMFREIYFENWVKNQMDKRKTALRRFVEKYLREEQHSEK